MKLLLCALSLLCVVAVISAKRQIEENLDPIEPETREHSSKKYSKEHQKPHHHGHKHKKHPVAEDLPKEAETKPKDAPVEVPEAEVKLQSDVETSKKAIKEEKRKAETEDLHLQDLTYEETLKKDKKKKKGHHHGPHHAEILEKPKGKADHKLFAEQESKTPEEKVIEDSFEPLTRSEKKGKGKDKRTKDKSKGKKKASEKSKDKSKKPKEGKKNKDKSKKSKEGKRRW